MAEQLAQAGLEHLHPIWGNTQMKKARMSSRAGGPTGASATVATVIVTTMRRTLALT